MWKLTDVAALGFMMLAAASCTSDRGYIFDPPPAGDRAALPVEESQHTDVIIQIVPPIVDVLWTIDNSCSMVEEQTALTENFPRFMNYFVGSGVDYHVGVISTDLDQDSHAGQLRHYTDGTDLVRYIDEDTKDPVEVFKSMATMGTDGSGWEKGKGAVYTALGLRRNDPANIGFYRQEASIHTIIISDEDDDTQDHVISEAEFIAWYKALKSGGWRKTFSSIVSPDTAGGFSGTPYLRLTSAIGGIPWDIRTEQWDRVLDLLGVQASGLRREFFLSQRPVLGTIEVRVIEEDKGETVTNLYIEAVFSGDGSLVQGHWVYDEARNSIRFVNLFPDPLSRVEITYTLLSNTVAPIE